MHAVAAAAISVWTFTKLVHLGGPLQTVWNRMFSCLPRVALFLLCV
jgi:hypothetical protein